MHRSTQSHPLLKLFAAVVAVLLAVAGVSAAAPAQAAKPWRSVVSGG